MHPWNKTQTSNDVTKLALDDYDALRGSIRTVEPCGGLQYVERQEESRYTTEQAYDVPVPAVRGDDTWTKVERTKLKRRRPVKKWTIPEPLETMRVIGHVTKKRMMTADELDWDQVDNAYLRYLFGHSYEDHVTDEPIAATLEAAPPSPRDVGVWDSSSEEEDDDDDEDFEIQIDMVEDASDHILTEATPATYESYDSGIGSSDSGSSDDEDEHEDCRCCWRVVDRWRDEQPHVFQTFLTWSTSIRQAKEGMMMALAVCAGHLRRDDLCGRCWIYFAYNHPWVDWHEHERHQHRHDLPSTPWWIRDMVRDSRRLRGLGAHYQGPHTVAAEVHVVDVNDEAVRRRAQEAEAAWLERLRQRRDDDRENALRRWETSTLYPLDEDEQLIRQLAQQREREDETRTVSSSNDESADSNWFQDVFEITSEILSFVAKAAWETTKSVVMKLWEWIRDSTKSFIASWFVDTSLLSDRQVLGISAVVAWGIIELVLYFTGGNTLKVTTAVRMAALSFLVSIGLSSISKKFEEHFWPTAVTSAVGVGIAGYMRADELWCTEEYQKQLLEHHKQQAEYQGVEFDVLPCILAGIVSILTMHLVPSSNGLTGFLKKADQIPKALRGIGSMTTMVREAIRYVQEEIVVACGGTRSLDRAVPIDVTAILDRVEALSSLDYLAKIPTDDAVRREIEQTFHAYYRMRQMHYGNRTITTLLDKYAGLIGSLMTKAAAHTPGRSDARPKPVVCMLRGSSGVGKSELLYYLAGDMLTDMGDLDEVEDETEIRKRITKCMYARTPEQEYWDGMEKQPIVLYDDFGQVVDSIATPSIEFMEMIRLANRFPYPLHMAKAEQKDTAYFSALHMFATTNLKVIDPASIVEPEAIYTRIDFSYEVRVKEQYQIDPKSTRRQDHRIDRNKVKEFTTDIYEFFPWNPETGAVMNESVDYEDLIAMLSSKREEFKRAHEESKKAILTRVQRRRNMRKMTEATMQGAVMSRTKNAWDDFSMLARTCNISRTRMTMALALAHAQYQRREISERFARAIGPWKRTLTQLAALGTVVATVLAGWKLFKYVKRQPATLESGRDLMRQVRVAKYDGVSSQQAQELMTSVRSNYYFVNERFPAFGIRGRCFLFNVHYWSKIEETFTFSKVGKEAKYTIRKSEVKVHELDKRDLRSDVIVLEMPPLVPMVRTMTHHFANIDDMATLKMKRVAMVVPYPEGWYHKVGTVVRFHAMDLSFSGEDTKRMQVLETNLPTVHGDCGGLYIIDDDKYTKKICGFHFASINAGGALAFPLTEKDYDFLSGNEVVLNGLVEPTTDACPVSAVITEGRVKRVAPASVKSSIVQTPIFGEVCETTVMPAKLGPLLKEGGPGIAGLNKLGGDIPLVDDDEIDDAVRSLKEKLYTDAKTEEVRRVLTFDEAVKGIDQHDFIRPINRTRSAGYPWSLEATTGKRKWFGVDEWTLGKECQVVRDEVKRKEDLLKDGKWEPSLYTDTLKDETRPIEKVRAGKTRVFAAAPMDLLILTRMYFLSFFSFIMKNRIYNEVAVGIQCQSYEWDILAKRMLVHGDGSMIAGDFTNYDGTLHPKILLAVCDIVNDWYRDGNDNIRKLLFEDIVHSWHVTGPFVTSWFKSQPSGNPGTAIFNSLYNSIAVRIATNRIQRVKFNDVAAMVSYGDDNLISVSRNAPWLTQKALSEAFASFGMTYTSETKGDVVENRMLEEVSFLKRGFRFDSRERMWMAPLQPESINERLNWQKKSKMEWDLLLLNAEMAVFEWALHEDDDFMYWSKRIDEVIRGHGKHLRINSLAYYRALVREGKAAKAFPGLTYA